MSAELHAVKRVETRRTAAVLAGAWLGYFGALENHSKEGIAGPLLLMRSRGGIPTVDTAGAIRAPVESGPAGGRDPGLDRRPRDFLSQASPFEWAPTAQLTLLDDESLHRSRSSRWRAPYRSCRQRLQCASPDRCCRDRRPARSIARLERAGPPAGSAALRGQLTRPRLLRNGRHRATVTDGRYGLGPRLDPRASTAAAIPLYNRDKAKRRCSRSQVPPDRCPGRGVRLRRDRRPRLMQCRPRTCRRNGNVTAERHADRAFGGAAHLSMPARLSRQASS